MNKRFVFISKHLMPTKVYQTKKTKKIMWMHLYLLLEQCFSKASDLELETTIDEIIIKQKSYWGVLNFLKKL
jgi:hypothetical protein